MQGEGVVRSGEKTCLVRVNGFPGAGNVSGNSGKGAGAGFQQGDGEAFPERGEHKCVRSLHPPRDVGLEAQEADAVVEAKFAGKALEFRLQWSGARDDELRGRVQAGEGAQEGRVVLDAIKAARSQPNEAVADTEFVAEGGTVLWVRLEFNRVDAVGQDGEGSWSDHAGGAVRVRDGKADGGDLVG